MRKYRSLSLHSSFKLNAMPGKFHFRLIIIEKQNKKGLESDECL